MKLPIVLLMLGLAGPAVAQTQPQAAPLPPQTNPPSADGTAPANDRATYGEGDVLSAAEAVFGKGAKGLAEIIERTFKEQGRPNAYIVGREGSGAFVVGLRYGGGTLYHKVEGQRPIHWAGPSVGFDAGGDASKVFALVYNLDDSEDIYRRYPAAEGKAYFVGGFTANYLQRDNVIVVPIKLGVGVRLGVNAGYMKFTRRGTVQPF